jgi:PleD family two-component response regulator
MTRQPAFRQKKKEKLTACDNLTGLINRDRLILLISGGDGRKRNRR